MARGNDGDDYAQDLPRDLTEPYLGAVILSRLEHHKRQLDRIEGQIEATNGRVRTIELWRARMEGANWALSWLPPTLSALVVAIVAVVIPLVVR